MLHCETVFDVYDPAPLSEKSKSLCTRGKIFIKKSGVNYRWDAPDSAMQSTIRSAFGFLRLTKWRGFFCQSYLRWLSASQRLTLNPARE
jgi:hypothetical protein